MDGSQAQFDPLGEAYAKSKSHATGRTLGMVVDRAACTADETVCDVGTGTGHTALALAGGARRVVAADLTLGMMRSGRALAAERGVSNVCWVQAGADSLPFPDGSFDVLVSRTAAHHFPDLAASCREFGRVVRRGGRVVVTDLAGHDDPELQKWVHRLEVLHDPTHVRSHTGSEWTAALEGGGFQVARVEGGLNERLVELDGGTNLDEWIRRSRTAPEAATEIRHLLEHAPDDVANRLQVHGHGPDLHFNIYKLVISARL